MSGKGGVGKSSVTVMLAREFAKRGLKTGILDADITGPSVPRLTGIPAGTSLKQNEKGVIPVETKGGIPVISLNLFLKDEEEPVIWRGPLLSGAVKQFWTDVYWGELDCLFIDMPPGTGDVVLTVMQSLPLDGAVVVSTPHDLASMVVAKSVQMARKMDVEIFGLVENMAFIKCPDCGRDIRLFDDAPLLEYLEREKVGLLGKLPMERQIAGLSGGTYMPDGPTMETMSEIGGRIAGILGV